jgi:hypothetical protein
LFVSFSIFIFSFELSLFIIFSIAFSNQKVSKHFQSKLLAVKSQKGQLSVFGLLLKLLFQLHHHQVFIIGGRVVVLSIISQSTFINNKTQ